MTGKIQLTLEIEYLNSLSYGQCLVVCPICREHQRKITSPGGQVAPACIRPPCDPETHQSWAEPVQFLLS